MNLSELARARFRRMNGEPAFLCSWPDVLFVHYEVAPSVLQPGVPFELELFEGCAIVSLVAFTMRRFRPAWGGRVMERLAWPVSTNSFFNVRTYVRHQDESGAYFMAQWLSHPFCLLGQLPGLRLPWHWGWMRYSHETGAGRACGRVRGSGSLELSYDAVIDRRHGFSESARGSLAEFCLERYSAFALRGGRPVIFRIWHEAWPQRPAEVTVADSGLLVRSGDWVRGARQLGGHYSPGCDLVWFSLIRSVVRPAA